MTNFDDFLNEQLQNPAFKKEYDTLEKEFQEIRKQISNQSQSPSDRSAKP